MHKLWYFCSLGPHAESSLIVAIWNGILWYFVHVMLELYTMFKHYTILMYTIIY